MSSSSSQIGPAGCKVVLRLFAGEELADIIIDYVKEKIKCILVPGLLEVYARVRRPKVCHLRFASTSEMFQGLRLLREVSLSSEKYDNLRVGVDKPMEERARTRPVRQALAQVKDALKELIS